MRKEDVEFTIHAVTWVTITYPKIMPFLGVPTFNVAKHLSGLVELKDDTGIRLVTVTVPMLNN